MHAFTSRPRYRDLEPATGRRHILVLERAAVEESLEAACRQRFEPVADRLHMLLAGPGPDGIAELPELLADAQPDWRVYAAGTEPFLWSVALAARTCRVGDGQLQLCHAGSSMRRVWCTHCHGTSEGVHTSVFACHGCGRNLFVRDHFSRRLGAFMGVQVDAEVPGEVPAAERIYA